MRALLAAAALAGVLAFAAPAAQAYWWLDTFTCVPEQGCTYVGVLEADGGSTVLYVCDVPSPCHTNSGFPKPAALPAPPLPQGCNVLSVQDAAVWVCHSSG